MKKFGILNEDLGDGTSENNIFTYERRSIGVKHPIDREWCGSIGSNRQWWSSRYIWLTTKRVL